MDAPFDRGTADLPRYQQVFAVLRQRIADGTYPVGGAMPTEGEIGAEFSVSRYTVREALRRLVDLGLVSRRQGSGTVVMSALPRGRYVQSMRSLSELMQYAYETRLRILSAEEEVLGEDEAPFLPAAAGERWLVMRGIRQSPDLPDPICFVSAFVPPRFAHLRAEIVATRGPVYSLLEARTNTPVADAIQEISGAPLPPDVRRALGLKRSAFGMRFVRRYLAADGSVIVTSINWHPAENFSYRMHLTSGELGGG